MAKVLFVDRKASFLLVDDVNAQLKEWLGVSTTNLHGRAARYFASSSGCEKIVTAPTRIEGGVLDFVLTDVPDVVWLVSPVSTWDHIASFMDIVVEQPIPHLLCSL